MSKIIIKINIEGEVNIDSDYEENECQKSQVYKIIQKKLENEGEIDEITLKYQEQSQKQAQTIELENLI